MDLQVSKIGDSPIIGLSTPPIGCVLDLAGLPGGSNKIYDRSPYGNIGTVIGATWTRLPSGLWCLDFDGTDDHIVVADAANLRITGDLTLEAWVNWTSGTSDIIAKGEFDGFKIMYEMRVSATGTISFLCGSVAGDDAAVNITTTDTLTSGKWAHIVCIKDGATSYIYIDGSESKTGTAATNYSDAYDVWLGERITGNFDLTGYIALPRIYNRALSALEIQNHFNREKYLFGVW